MINRFLVVKIVTRGSKNGIIWLVEWQCLSIMSKKTCVSIYSLFLNSIFNHEFLITLTRMILDKLLMLYIKLEITNLMVSTSWKPNAYIAIRMVLFTDTAFKASGNHPGATTKQFIWRVTMRNTIVINAAVFRLVNIATISMTYGVAKQVCIRGNSRVRVRVVSQRGRQWYKTNEGKHDTHLVLRSGAWKALTYQRGNNWTN